MHFSLLITLITGKHARVVQLINRACESSQSTNVWVSGGKSATFFLVGWLKDLLPVFEFIEVGKEHGLIFLIVRLKDMPHFFMQVFGRLFCLELI